MRQGRLVAGVELHLDLLAVAVALERLDDLAALVRRLHLVEAHVVVVATAPYLAEPGTDLVLAEQRRLEVIEADVGGRSGGVVVVVGESVRRDARAHGHHRADAEHHPTAPCRSRRRWVGARFAWRRGRRRRSRGRPRGRWGRGRWGRGRFGWRGGDRPAFGRPPRAG